MTTTRYKTRTPRAEALTARLFWGFVVSCGVLIALYTALVSISTMNLVVAAELEKEVGAARGAVAELEAEYIALRQTITPERALAFGFIAVEEKGFAIRTSLRALTLNSEGR